MQQIYKYVGASLGFAFCLAAGAALFWYSLVQPSPMVMADNDLRKPLSSQHCSLASASRNASSLSYDCQSTSTKATPDSPRYPVFQP